MTAAPFPLIAAASILLFSQAVEADQAAVAVAANFTVPAQRLAAAFEVATGHTLQLSFGATGKFYAQIVNGAPFGALLAADEVTPAKLETEGWGIAGSRFNYAQGRLVLWSRQADTVDSAGEILKGDYFHHLAIANPKLAPYGTAAFQVLERLGLQNTLAPKLVEGENIGQTFQFVATGNAELGFVALSQLVGQPPGSRWLVPEELYSPIIQQALLLTPGKSNEAAQGFLTYLKTEAARLIIEEYGYKVPFSK